MTGELDGHITLIVGAGPGVGRATAMAFAEAGASVALAARGTERLRQLADEVTERSGSPTLPVFMDLADLESCRSCVEQTVDRFGRIDAVVNVATRAGANTSIAESDFTEWAKTFAVNVFGVMEVSRTASTHMVCAGGGSITQISTHATESLPIRAGGYSASKSAMASASMTMAREMGRHGIRVNVITPGYITGRSLDSLIERTASSRGISVKEADAALRRPAFLRVHVDPEDIAGAALFLASDRARHLTGVDLPVTAGHRG